MKRCNTDCFEWKDPSVFFRIYTIETLEGARTGSNFCVVFIHNYLGPRL